MAKVSVGNRMDFDMRDLDFSNLFYGSSYTATSSLFRVNYWNGAKDEFRGSGFQYDSNGIPTSGTVKSYGAYDYAGKVVLVTGISVLVRKIVDAAESSGKADDMRIIKSELSGNDKFLGGKRDDTLFAYNGNDMMRGAAGNDRLNGGDGKDRLEGGAGRDTLIGGDGADTFIFRKTGHSDGNSRDKIMDFSHFQKDKIDLSDIDANTGRNGDQKFDFIGTNDFSGKAGELRYEKKGGTTWIEADIDGDGKAEMEIALAGSISLKAGDFLL